MSGWIKVRSVCQLIAALTLASVLAFGATSASAADGASSPQERARFVAIAAKLEAAPLNPSLQAERSWALDWLTNAPDVSVTVCGDPLGGVIGSDYSYAPEILAQYIFSMAVLIIEHPEMVSNPNAQQLAGVEGALKGYRSILREKPDAKSTALDGLLQTQSRGTLPDFVQKAYLSCKSKE